MKGFFQNIVTYIWSSAIVSDTPMVRIGMIIAGSIIVLGIIVPLVLTLLRKKGRKLFVDSLLRDWSTILRYAGVVWLLILFLRFEDITPFDRRLWTFLPIVPVFVYLVIALRRYRVTIPQAKKNNLLEERYQRYLPKAKRM